MSYERERMRLWGWVRNALNTSYFTPGGTSSEIAPDRHAQAKAEFMLGVD